MKKGSLLCLFLCVLLSSCNSSKVDDVLDLADGVPRKPIDTTKLGVNAFVNDRQFGSIADQFSEIKNVLRLNFVRVLFAWNNDVQPSPEASPDFSFYDRIIRDVPEGMDVLVIVTGLPSWMHNSDNWVSANPRTDFVNLWVKRVVQRYAQNGQIVGWEIWNEPNESSDPDNAVMDIANNAENYVEILAAASAICKDLAPGKLVVSGATTSINQNYPDALNYNRDMRDAGAAALVDVRAVHYYGKQFENVVRPDGIESFLNGLTRPIWITESGAQGVDKQLAYGEQVWPYLLEHIPGIARIYQYQFAEATSSATTYGLKNLTPGQELSDLYVFLRDRP